MGVLVLSTTLMGTGYALWTDELTINTAVTTGNLDMDITYTTDKNTFADKLDLSTEYSELNRTTVKENEVKYDLTNMYPGAFETYMLAIKNKGTIGTKGSINVTYEGELEEYMYVQIQEFIFTEKSGGKPVNVVTDNKKQYTIAEARTYINEILVNKGVIEPEHEIKIKFTIGMSNKAENDTQGKLGENEQITMNFDWVQHNQ